MQNEKIEDDFVQAKNLTKAIRLIADSQEGDEWVHASLYWIAKAHALRPQTAFLNCYGNRK
jgi:hypothetical protein